jgi:D-alanine-D-alanine ligase
LAFGAVAENAGVATIPRLDLAVVSDDVLATPLIVKPRYGGSSIGVELVDDLRTAQSLARSSPLYEAGAIVESYLEGWFDVNIAVRTSPGLQVSAIERPIKASEPLLSYADKYVPDQGMAGAARELPALLSDELNGEIRKQASNLALATGVRGVARIDFMTNGTDLAVNEINTIPGSMARYLWIDPPIPFETLLRDLITEATDRPAYRTVLQGADGLLLRSAASVAAKLA